MLPRGEVRVGKEFDDSLGISERTVFLEGGIKCKASRLFPICFYRIFGFNCFHEEIFVINYIDVIRCN